MEKKDGNGTPKSGSKLAEEKRSNPGYIRERLGNSHKTLTGKEGGSNEVVKRIK